MELSKETIMRAWKDEGFRNSLSPEEQAAIPNRPTAADGSGLTDEQLEAAAGGTTPGCIVVGGVAGGYIVAEIVD